MGSGVCFHENIWTIYVGHAAIDSRWQETIGLVLLPFNLSLQRCKYKFKTVPQRGVVSGQPAITCLVVQFYYQWLIVGVHRGGMGFTLRRLYMIGSEYLYSSLAMHSNLKELVHFSEGWLEFRQMGSLFGFGWMSV